MVSIVLGITEISAIIGATVAAVGVLVGVVYYILDVRNQRRMRQTDLLVRLFSNMIDKDWLEAWEKVRDRESVDYGEYKEKYGFVEANQVYLFYDQLGRLLQKGLIDIDLISSRSSSGNQKYSMC